MSKENEVKEAKKTGFSIRKLSTKYLLITYAMYIDIEDKKTKDVTQGWSIWYLDPEMTPADGANGAELIKFFFRSAPLDMLLKDGETSLETVLPDGTIKNNIQLGIYECNTNIVRKKTGTDNKLVSSINLVNAKKCVLPIDNPLMSFFNIED